MHMCSSIINLNNPYTFIEEEIIGNLDERDDAIDNERIEEVDNVHIGDVVVNKIGIKDAKSAFLTLKQFLEQRRSGVTPLI
jgi:hypothetical protein